MYKFLLRPSNFLVRGENVAECDVGLKMIGKGFYRKWVKSRHEWVAQMDE